MIALLPSYPTRPNEPASPLRSRRVWSKTSERNYVQ